MKLRNVLVPVDLFEMACDFIESALKDAGSDPSEDETYMKLKNILTVAESVFDD
jgi:hypothetical protein|tara:strand:- start:656 stop:817 length:162 start_codon:yes stop_codon:yes gene_type:complete